MRWIAGILLIAGCSDLPLSQPTEWTEADGYRFRELAVARGDAGFEAVTDSGVEFVNHLSDAGIVENRHRMNGSGVAAGDVNGDGLPDLFFAAVEAQPRLYLNRGAWRFEEFTAQSGLVDLPGFTTGVVLADVDGDADLDLFVTSLTSPNALYLNDGSGQFAAAEAGLSSNRGSTSVAVADTDSDGDLDLYVANYKRIAARDSLSPERLVFDNLVGPDGSVVPEMRAHFRVEERDGRPLRLELGEPDQYYLNRGDGTFESIDVPGVQADWGLGARLQDMTGDGVPDLYVANDFESPDYFLEGDGRGGWSAEGVSLDHTPNSSMSVAVADVDHDGFADVFVPDMLSPDPMRSRYEAGTAAPPDPDTDLRPQYMQNALFAGLGGGDFAEVSWSRGVAATEWSWTALFTDVDLDGWDDLLISTGHTFDVQDVDAQAREREAIRRVRSVDAFRALILDYPRLPLPNVAYRNIGGTRFEATEEGWGIGSSPDITHGMALADLDGDGDLDLVANRENQPAGIFRNSGEAPRIAIRFALDGPNPYGIGARVTLGGRTQEMIAGGHYLSSSEPLLVFAALSDSVEVDVDLRGQTRRFTAYPNRLYEVQSLEGEAGASGSPDAPGGSGAAAGATGGTGPATRPSAGASDEASPGARPSASGPNAATRPGAAAEQGARPIEIVPAGGTSILDDRSPLVHRPLRHGPPLATGSQSGAAGSEAGPLLIGGLTSRAAILLEGGAQLPITPVRWISAAVAGDLMVGVVEGTAGTTRLQSFRNGQALQDLALPINAGSVTLADLDGDGWTDAFVGARTAEFYPNAAPSLLLRGHAGGFETWSTLDAGLATGAAFGDADGDGDFDLAVASEWGPVRVFINDGGTLTNATESWGLAQTTGLWQDVDWGDLNGDGRLDLLAGNWGWNSRYGRVGAADYRGRGLRLYPDDHDGDGRPDPVEAEYRDDINGWSPMTDFATLRRALPILSRRVSSWRAYAGSTVEDLLGPQNSWMEVSTLATTAFLNQGDRFQAQALPDVVQWSLAEAVYLADVDGDGRAEALIAQNEFDIRPHATMRQDAGRGIFLQQEEGGWSVQSLGLPGDQEDAVFWRGSAVISLRDGSVHRIPLAPSAPVSRSP